MVAQTVLVQIRLSRWCLACRVQITRSFGAQVVATGRPAHAVSLRSIGATVIDMQEDVAGYDAQHTAFRPLDLVYDTI